jgi:hypothetical protein
LRYQKPRDPERPLICLDETSKQLVIETREPIPAKSGHPIRHDCECVRNGLANIFMTFAPLEGWRNASVTNHRAVVDYAQALKERSDVRFPDAKQIVWVKDNLSTHTAALLCAAFPPEEARRLAKRFERHCTQTRKLARHGRIRTRRPVRPMPGSTHSRQANARKRGRRLVGPTKQTSRKSRLTVHHQRRPRQTQEAIPTILSDWGD